MESEEHQPTGSRLAYKLGYARGDGVCACGPHKFSLTEIQQIAERTNTARARSGIPKCDYIVVFEIWGKPPIDFEMAEPRDVLTLAGTVTGLPAVRRRSRYRTGRRRLLQVAKRCDDGR